MTTTSLCNQSLGELVTEEPARAAVFERLGLDYCCHGRRSLAEACASKGLDAETVAAQVEQATGAPASWRGGSLTDLAAHVVATHHRYLWDELPLLDALSAKVARVHGERHPELRDTRALVGAFRADLEQHMRKEELVLFPAIERLEQGVRDFPFGSISNPIGMMEAEHERDGAILEQLRARTDGYTVPADACASYRTLYERLGRLERDTHEHIHLENNVLFPGAASLHS
jgi:regulator of cell morphogenesis and NO signaling